MSPTKDFSAEKKDPSIKDMLLLGVFCLSVRFGVAHLVRLLQDHLKAEAGLANIFFFPVYYSQLLYHLVNSKLFKAKTSILCWVQAILRWLALFRGTSYRDSMQKKKHNENWKERRKFASTSYTAVLLFLRQWLLDWLAFSLCAKLRTLKVSGIGTLRAIWPWQCVNWASLLCSDWGKNTNFYETTTFYILSISCIMNGYLYYQVLFFVEANVALTRGKYKLWARKLGIFNW